MSFIRLSAIAATAFALLACEAGCSSTTTVTTPVPPRVDLGQFHSIGLVTFSANEGDQQFRQECTQQFLTALQDAQPGTRIVELGDEGRVLASVQCSTWDARTFAAIQKKHGVDAVILGRFNATRVKPDIRLSTEWKSLSVKSDVNSNLSAKLVETSKGATMWTDSAQTTATVAQGQFNGRGEGGFGVSDTDEAYRQMLGCLVQDITDDFRTHYITKRVPKEQLQTAIAE